jgi:hypothetical protein
MINSNKVKTICVGTVLVSAIAGAFYKFQKSTSDKSNSKT